MINRKIATQKRVAYIVQKEKFFKAQVERLQRYLESASVDSVDAKMRSDHLATLFTEYTECHKELALLQPNHPQLDLFSNVESRYYDVASTVIDLQMADVKPNTANSSVTDQKLVVIRVSNSNGIQDGSPNDREVSIVSPYYSKHVFAMEQIDAIFDLPTINFEATADDLSMLMDKSRRHVHLLDQVGINVTDNAWIVRILEKSLPRCVLSRWLDKLDFNKFPTLDEFYKFLQSTIFVLRTLEQSRERRRTATPLTSRNDNSTTRKRTLDNIGQIQNATAAKISAPSQVITQDCSCVKSSKPHRLFVCPAFLKLNIKERWNFVNTNKLCHNCLWAHRSPCKSNKRCKECNRDHHTQLHDDNGPNH